MGWKYLTRRLHASFRLVELAKREREREQVKRKRWRGFGKRFMQIFLPNRETVKLFSCEEMSVLERLGLRSTFDASKT